MSLVKYGNQSKLGVLYLDDELQALKYFRRAMEEYFPVWIAESSLAAREIMKEHADDIALVLSDIRMPQESGVSFLTWLREEYPSKIRWVVTAYSDLNSAIEAINKGAVERYIAKPWNTEKLTQILIERLSEYEKNSEDQSKKQHALSEIQQAISILKQNPEEETDSSTSTLQESDFSSAVSQFERQLIVEALSKTDGNIQAAAKLLQITPRILSYRVQKLGIKRSVY